MVNTNTNEKEVQEEVQLVAFMLEGEEFAVEIQRVREVLKMTQVTPLPKSADFIEGVINLRGEVIPVVDLRKRFELAAGEKTEQTRIIIVEIQGDDVGLIVDSVSEVLRIPSGKIQPPPSTVAGTRTDLIHGVGKMDDRLLILLKLEKILTSSDKIALDEVTVSE